MEIIRTKMLTNNTLEKLNRETNNLLMITKDLELIIDSIKINTKKSVFIIGIELKLL